MLDSVFTTKEAVEEILLRVNRVYGYHALRQVCLRNSDIGVKKGRDWLLSSEDIDRVIEIMR
jgi:predicted secreted protein